MSGKHPLSGRKIYYDDKGNPYTEKTVTIEVDGETVVVPSVWDGKVLDNVNEIYKRALSSGEVYGLGKGWTQEEADAFARNRSNKLSEYFKEPEIVASQNERLNPFNREDFLDQIAGNLNANPGGGGLRPRTRDEDLDIASYIEMLEDRGDIDPVPQPEGMQTSFPEEPGFFQSEIQDNIMAGRDPAAGFGAMQRDANYLGFEGPDPINRVLNSIPNLGEDASLEPALNTLMEHRQREIDDEVQRRLEEMAQPETPLQDMVKKKARTQTQQRLKEVEERYGEVFDVGIYQNPNDPLGRLDQVVMKKKDPTEFVTESEGLIKTKAENVQSFIKEYENDYVIDSIDALRIANMMNPSDGSAPAFEEDILETLRPGTVADYTGRSSDTEDTGDRDSRMRDKRLDKLKGLNIDNVEDFAMREGETARDYKKRVSVMQLPSTYFESPEYIRKVEKVARSKGIDMSDPTQRADALDPQYALNGISSRLGVLRRELILSRETDNQLRREKAPGGQKITKTQQAEREKAQIARDTNIANLQRQIVELEAKEERLSKGPALRLRRGVQRNKLNQVMQSMIVLGTLSEEDLKKIE